MSTFRKCSAWGAAGYPMILMTKHFKLQLAAWALALACGLPFASLAKDATPPAKLKLDATAINRDERTGHSYSAVVKKVTPSVVNIISTRTLRASRFHPSLDDPGLNPFFGDDPSTRRGRRGGRGSAGILGSGVVVSDDGYILTNNHVVEGADSDGVKVSFGDGTQEIPARVIGTDPQTDIAVIKVDAKDLPAITLADSDKLEVGDVVFAVGNPFNVGQTVTMGIVSALGRGGFGITDYEDFIQTDAAMNMGNSGGPLVDAKGRLIGINQSIVNPAQGFTVGSGNIGIGFAVPINLAKSVMNRLIADGKVTRGFLGVMLQPLTPELAKSFNLQNNSGALVGDVSPNTPAAEAGLKDGDIITEINGKKTGDSRHFRLMVAESSPGAKVALTVWRDGKAQTLTAKLGALPGGGGVVARPEIFREKNERDALDGVEVDELSPAMRREHSIPADIKGALVTDVNPESNANEARLRPGNVIIEIDRQPVTDADHAVKLCDEAKGDHILLRVWSRERGGSGSKYVTVDNTKKSREPAR